MKYKRLGNTGLQVSELCLGTMTFGSSFHGIGEVDQKRATTMIDHALDAGVNFFDTADIYSYGESEEILGQALNDIGVDRDKVVIATKVFGPMSEEAAGGTGDVNNQGLSRKHIMASVDDSLRRLDTEYIDLYQIHGWDPDTPIEETLQALNDLVRSGKVRYIGCSNVAARHLAKSLQVSKRHNWAEFASLQAYYNVAGRDLEHELVPLCEEEGLGILPWSPLAGGFLTGKFKRGEDGPEDARRSGFDFPPIDKEMAFDAVDVMEEVAEDRDASIPQVALAWLRHQPAVSSVIIGAKKLDQLEDNLGSAELELEKDELERISEVTEPDTLYPQWMYEFQNRDRSEE